MKECFKCDRVLPLKEFYKHPMMADGRLNKCKECTKKDVRENYAARRDYYSEYDRIRHQQPERREKKAEYQRTHRKNNKRKNWARSRVGKAKRQGEIAVTPCVHCSNPNVEAHHEDYSKPLDVIWVCFKCHREHYHNQIVVSDYGQEVQP